MKQPNLLFIWTDEQRRDTMACYGNRSIRTPHLNRLADQSFVFDHCYCTQPVCTPSRGSIMTGLWPHQHGATANNVALNPDARTMAELVVDDYRTAYYGKWHLGDEITAQHGFDEWVSIEDSYRPFYSDPESRQQQSSYHHFLVENGFPPQAQDAQGNAIFSRNFVAGLAEPYTKAGFLGQQASQFIHEQSPDQPWMLYVNFLEPHMPFFGPLNNAYAPEGVEVSPIFNRKPDDDVSLRNRYWSRYYAEKGFSGWPLCDEWHWRRLRANYDGLMTMVDNAVGRILEALEATGQAENTLVVFTSDHGDMMGDHSQLGKCVMYEPSVSVPLLVRAPWLNRQCRHVSGRFSQVDLVPTLLELMEQPMPSELAGQSRVDALLNQMHVIDGDVIVVWNPLFGAAPAKPLTGFTENDLANLGSQRWHTLVSADGWKLNVCMTDRCELFNLNDDPYEQVNRIDASDCRSRAQTMLDKLRNWQSRTGDQATLPTQL